LGDLGQIKLAQLTADQVDDFLARKRDATMARSSLVRLRLVLVMALNFAIRRDLVGRNVAAVTEQPTGPKRESRSLMVALAKKFL